METNDTMKALEAMPERYGKNQGDYALAHWFDAHYETIRSSLSAVGPDVEVLPNGGWMTIESATKDKTILAKCFTREDGDIENWYPAVIYWANGTWNGQNEYTIPRPFSWKKI